MESYLLEIRDSLGGPPRLVPVRAFPFWIGRGPGNDLVLHDPLVSRRHARLEADGKRLTVTDNASRNGVFLNTVKVAGSEDVHAGDVLSVGPYHLRLSLATRPQALPAGGGPETVEYYRPSAAWDPLATFTAGIAAPREPAEVAVTVPWERLLRLLVSGSTPEFYDLVLELLAQLVPFDRCFLVLLEDESLETLRIAAQRFSPGYPARRSTEVYVSREILKRVVSTREAVTVSTGEHTFVPTESFILSGARSLLCVPLVAGDTVVGVLYLDRLLEGRAFSEATVEKLAPLTALVALKIENEQLLEEHLQAQISKRDLEVARAIQERFLPRKGVTLGNYAFEAFSQPCLDVGGDCLDFVAGPGGRLTFVAGDVTGKGLPASLYMVGVLSTLRAHLADGFQAPQVMPKLAEYVRERFRSDHFLTLFLGELDTASGALVYANAGHPAPLLFRLGGAVRELEGRDPALNIVPPGEGFGSFREHLAPGDLLVVYTDGITERRDAKGETFGKERLAAAVRERAGADLEALRRGILAAIESFGDGPPQDDVTLILLRRDDGAAA